METRERLLHARRPSSALIRPRLQPGMSLSLNETFRISAPPDRVWRFLKNPAEVVTCLPGAELTETIDAQTYGGRVKVKVGPITAAYAGKATLTQVDDATRRMQIVAEGKESGGSGSARMTMTGVVTALPDGGSEVSVDAAIDIAGRVMQFGRGLIESVNKQLFRQFADAVQSKLQVAHAAEQAEAAAAETASTHAAELAVADTDATPGVGEATSASMPIGATLRAPDVVSGAAGGRAPSPAAPIAQGEELRALPLIWRVFVTWLSSLFGGKR